MILTKNRKSTKKGLIYLHIKIHRVICNYISYMHICKNSYEPDFDLYSVKGIFLLYQCVGHGTKLLLIKVLIYSDLLPLASLQVLLGLLWKSMEYALSTVFAITNRTQESTRTRTGTSVLEYYSTRTSVYKYSTSSGNIKILLEL